MHQFSPIKKIHTPEKIFDKISISIFITGLNQKFLEYISSYFKSIYYNLLPPDIPRLYLNINQKSVVTLEFQRQNRANYENLSKEDKKLVEKYVNGNLLYNNFEYPIKLRVKGDRDTFFRAKFYII